MAARSSKDEQIREISDRYRNAVFAQAYKALGNSHDAQDAAQEVFLRIFLKLDTFRGESELTTWIYRITFNVCSNKRLEYARAGGLQALQRDDEAHMVEDPDGNPEVIFDRAEEPERARMFLRRLPRLQRKIATMYFVDGLGYKEIAGRLNISPGTVASKLSKAKSNLIEFQKAQKGAGAR